MKVRLKFQKYGAMKFIGHLDVMRYFQKAFRRAGYDSEYTQGFNPHQIMSFAAPLGVGLTSDCEYVDISLNSSEEPEIMVNRINEVMSEGFNVTGFHILSEPEENEKKITAMSLVSSADYLVSLKDGYSLGDVGDVGDVGDIGNVGNVGDAGDIGDIGEVIMTTERFRELFKRFYAKNDITILKRTKKSEMAVNIRPMITMVAFDENEYVEGLRGNVGDLSRLVNNGQSFFLETESKAEVYENNIKVYMQLDTGSASNLKPELVMEAFCNENDIDYNPYAWQVHRLEIYTGDEATGRLISLDRFEK